MGTLAQRRGFSGRASVRVSAISVVLFSHVDSEDPVERVVDERQRAAHAAPTHHRDLERRDDRDVEQRDEDDRVPARREPVARVEHPPRPTRVWLARRLESRHERLRRARLGVVAAVAATDVLLPAQRLARVTQPETRRRIGERGASERSGGLPTPSRCFCGASSPND